MIAEHILAPAPIRSVGDTNATVRLNLLAHRLDGVAHDLTEPDADIDALRERLISMITQHPGEVLPYWMLVEILRREHSDAPAVYGELHRIWAACDGTLSGQQFIGQFAHTLDPYGIAEIPPARLAEGGLLVVFSDDLLFSDLLDLRDGQASLVGRVNTPQLVCSARDLDGIAPHRRTIIEDRLKQSKSIRLVRHRGVTVECHQQTFGPAIDTLLFHQVLHDIVVPQLAGRTDLTITEIGTGSGMLLCGLVNALGERVRRIVGSDVQEAAAQLTLQNLYRTIAQRFPERDFEPVIDYHLRPDSLSAMASGSTDVLITNPPYISSEQGDNHTLNPIEGTSVIREMLIGHGPRVLAPDGVMVLLYSSLCAAEVTRYLEESPLEVVEAPAPRIVPLDLAEVAAQPRWMRLLLSRPGLVVQMESPTYPYWHVLQVLVLRHQA